MAFRGLFIGGFTGAAVYLTLNHDVWDLIDQPSQRLAHFKRTLENAFYNQAFLSGPLTPPVSERELIGSSRSVVSQAKGFWNDQARSVYSLLLTSPSKVSETLSNTASALSSSLR